MPVTLPITVVQGTITANAGSVVIAAADGTGIGVQVSGTWVGTLTFKACIDGTNYVTGSLNPFPTGAAVSTTTANGIWTASFLGLAYFEVIATAWTSGTATVTLNLTR